MTVSLDQGHDNMLHLLPCTQTFPSASSPATRGVQIFVWSSDKVTKGSYSTLYSLMVGKKGSLPARIVLRAPTKLQPLTYMLMHLLMALGATLTSVSHPVSHPVKNHVKIIRVI